MHASRRALASVIRKDAEKTLVYLRAQLCERIGYSYYLSPMMRCKSIEEPYKKLRIEGAKRLWVQKYFEDFRQLIRPRSKIAQYRGARNSLTILYRVLEIRYLLILKR